MTNDRHDEALEQLFGAARQDAPELSDETTARVLAGVRAPTAPKPSPRPAPWSGVRGWVSALGGLGAVTALGVWIGVAVPMSGLVGFDTAADVGGFDLTTFYSGADWSALSLEEFGL